MQQLLKDGFASFLGNLCWMPDWLTESMQKSQVKALLCHSQPRNMNEMWSQSGHTDIYYSN